MEIPPEVAESLGCYVYLYIDPRDNAVKYIGKGAGGRAVAHLCDESENAKVSWLAELKSAGIKPRIEILARNLSESEALLVERCAIDIVGVSSLTNKVRGHDTMRGREPLDEIIIRERAKPANIRHKIIAFRLNRYLRPGMNDDEIYEGTRGVWKINMSRARRAEYAFGVYHGIVRGVFTVRQWHKGGSTEYSFRPKSEINNPNRWEFTGEIAPRDILDLYLHKSVNAYLPKKGSQSPFFYVNM